MKNILLVFGTRPEAIKMAPIITELNKSDKLSYKVCITGQHKEMLNQVLDVFSLKCEYNLNIMSPGQTLNDIFSKIVGKLQAVFEEFKPDLVLVHGDTSTSFATALACFYAKIPIGHVEAGLRTGNLISPWPEEGNRRLTSVIANYHFAPTENSKRNLLNEGVSEQRIIVTGNTVVDAVLMIKNRFQSDLPFAEKVRHALPSINFDEKIILITGHRRENFGSGFENICQAIKNLALSNPSLQFVYPVHLNPQVHGIVHKLLGNIENVRLIEPLSYTEFVYLMINSHIILTDSGGIQEEAPSLGKPVLLMRDTTERPEAVNAGTVNLVGTDCDNIVNSVNTLLQNQQEYEKMSKAVNPYGDGKAANKIVEWMEQQNAF